MVAYRHNHYVPIWYQRRFMLPGQSRYFRLDLHPETLARDGHKYRRRDIHEWSPDSIFAEDDLYTTRWGALSNTEIEQFFFGKLDSEAPSHLDYFTNFKHPDADGDAFHDFLTYMSVQKLRTPKGLRWLEKAGYATQKNMTLLLLQQLRNLHCAIWTECTWQIADASNSPTKFLSSLTTL